MRRGGSQEPLAVSRTGFSSSPCAITARASRKRTDKIFEPFFTTKAAAGLGLYVRHGIVEDTGIDRRGEAAGAVSSSTAPGKDPDGRRQ
jgi:hypothetical protein